MKGKTVPYRLLGRIFFYFWILPPLIELSKVIIQVMIDNALMMWGLDPIWTKKRVRRSRPKRATPQSAE